MHSIHHPFRVAVTVALSVVALLLVVAPCVSDAAPNGSEAESLVPASFDPKHTYTTYSIDELAEAIEHYEITKENFIGKRVKVLATYAVQDNYATWLNPHMTNRVLAAAQFASMPHAASEQPLQYKRPCDLELCSRAEMLGHLHGWGIVDTTLQLWSDPYLAVYLKTDKAYLDFIHDSTQLCDSGFAHRCYLWVRGTLRFTPVHLRGLITDSDRGLFYIDVDEYRLYRRSENQQWLNVKKAVSTTLDVMPTIVKVLTGLGAGN
jgi:hypothetical protein